MNNASFNILLLFLQVFFASELGGSNGDHVGDLIRTKSGKVFLGRSSKKTLSPKTDAVEGREIDEIKGSSGVHNRKSKNYRSRKSKRNRSRINWRRICFTVSQRPNWCDRPNPFKNAGRANYKILQHIHKNCCSTGREPPTTTTTEVPDTTTSATTTTSVTDSIDPVTTTTTSTTTDTTTTVEETNTSGCKGVKRVRKNVKKLTSAERQKLVTAMETLIGKGNRYVDLANFHGGPPNICNGDYCCPHREPTFFPWHRLYMAQMEDELGEALPYWDWTEDAEIPDLWEGIRAPIKEGERSICGDRGQFVTRHDSIRLNATILKSKTRDALDKKDFIDFSRAISYGPHGEVHVGGKCDIEEIATAGYDTLFYLHHSYVDYQWAFWQELQKLRGQSDPTIDGFDQPLPPFDSRRFNDNAKTLENSRAQDTFDYKKKFCYEYDELLFGGLTPAEFFEKHQKRPVPKSSRSVQKQIPREGRCGPVCQEIDGKKHCEEICSSDGGLARVSVGVVLPKDAPTGMNTFELCQDGECVEAGSLGTFGAPTKGDDYQGSEPPQIDKEKYFLRDTDVTAVVDKQGWTLKKPFEARMKESVVPNLPEPVVIVHELGEEGDLDTEKTSVMVSPKESPRRYGNLISEYSIKSNKNTKANNANPNANANASDWPSPE